MSQEIVIRELDTEQHEQSGSLLVRDANEAQIASNDDRELAGTVVDQIRKEINAIELEFNGTEDNPGFVSLAHKTWKRGVALREKALAARVAALDIWNRKIKRFEFDVEQKRREEERKAQEKATAEAQKKRDAEIADAKKLKDKAAVDALKEAALEVHSAPPKTPEVTKAAGLRRSNPEWDYRIINQNLIPDRFWVVDEKGLRATVKALGLKHGIPGISVFDRRAEGA